ncbi:sugar phosphate isomerase/epimerase family protein [Chloroflexota bacterium]
MPVYVSTSCLTRGSSIFEVLETYTRAGLNHVELGASHKHIDNLSPSDFEQYEINFIVHHYFPPPREPFIVNLASQDPLILKRSKEQINRSLQFCHSLGVKLFTLHAGFRVDPNNKLQFPKEPPDAPYETAFDTFIESIDEINSRAQQLGVRIAIENNVLSDYNLIDGQNPFFLLCEAEEFERLWREIPSTNVGMLLDLGHLKVTSHWLGFDKYEFVDRIQDRVFALHIHDNNGRVDQHKGLDESSWCLEVLGRKCFADIPIVLESSGLSIEQISQQLRRMEEQTY